MNGSRGLWIAVFWVVVMCARSVHGTCAVESQVVSTTAYKGCKAATGLDFNADKVKDPKGLLFCKNADCFTVWNQLLSLNALDCMANYRIGGNIYKLWIKASALNCFRAGGLYPLATTTSPAQPSPPPNGGGGGDSGGDQPKPDSSKSGSPSPTTPTPTATLPKPTGSSSSSRSNATSEVVTPVPPVPVTIIQTKTSGTTTVFIVSGVSGAIIAALVIQMIVWRRRRANSETESDFQSMSKRINEDNVRGAIASTPVSSPSREPSLHSTQMVPLGARLSTIIVPNSEHAFWNDEAINAVRIPYEKLTFIKLVSRGGYGEVHSGLYRQQHVAIKTLLPDRRTDMRQIEGFLAEVKLMAALEHEHIVKFVGVAWDSLNELCVVSEFMQRGDLRTLLWDYQADEYMHPTGFDVGKIKIALHVAHALTYMHSLQPKVLHRDLKSRNVLLDTNLNAKITDFGVSRTRSDITMTAGVGSTLWMAPEVMIGGRYDEKADVFSFGVVLSELDLHLLPYSHAVEPGTGRRLPDTVIIQMMTSQRISVEFSENDLYGMSELGRECVSLDPAARPSAAAVRHRIHHLWRSLTGLTL